jgi:hypothetical protein
MVFLVLVTPLLVGVVENVQEISAQEQEQQQQNTLSSNATTATSITKGLLQNSTSFGKIGSDTIKHPPELSILTVQPWPVVKPNENFTVSGKVVDKVTLDPISDEDISFLYESASQSIPADSLMEIQPQKTDAMGKFRVDVQAPSSEGAISITAIFNGTGLYHAAASPPVIVIVSNTTTTAATTGASPTTTANTTTAQGSKGE